MLRFHPALATALAVGLLGCSGISWVEPLPQRRVPVPWAHERSNLVPDPAVVWGRLDNGFRYAILPHAIPRQRVSVFLVVQAGSLHERGHELGYAHFVEHMVFRGTRDFPGDSANQAVQRFGISGGAHVNAATSPFETEYYLNDLPADDPGALPTALKILRGIADGPVFEASAVEQERGVIFSEQRSRQGTLMGARAGELEFLPPQSTMPRWQELTAVFTGTRLVKRHPGGVEKTLLAATPAKLRGFHDRWYRPERMILAVVGDVSAPETEELIRQTFFSLAGRGRPPVGGEIETPTPVSLRSPRVLVEPLDHEPAMRVTLGAVRPGAAADTAEHRREAVARHVALVMLARRLERLTEKGDAPFTSAEALVSHIVPAFEVTLLRAVAPPPTWPQTLATLETEARRAGEFGFTATEFTRAIKAQVTGAAAAARLARSQSSAALALVLAFAIARDVVFTSTEDDRRFTLAQLEALTADNCRAALRSCLPAGRLDVALMGPVPDEKSALKTARAAWAESARKPVAALPPLPPAKPFPYTHFGPPGKVVNRGYSARLDADLIQFANGVRLNLKRTDFEPGRIRMVIRLGGGRLLEPADRPGLSWRSFAWGLGGLRDLSRDDHAAALSEVSAHLTMNLNATDIQFVVTSEPEGLVLLLQSMAAGFTAPAFREEDWPRSLEVTRQVVAPFESTAGGVTTATLRYRMSNRHPTDRPPKFTEISQRTLDELKTWLLPQLAGGPLELSLLGDFETAPAIEAVAHTFGALPSRSADDPYAQQRQVTFPPQPFSDIVAFDGRPGLAVVSLAWPAVDVVAFSERLRGHILANILADRLRLKVRDELGETYSASASFAWDDGFTPSPAFLYCTIEAAPERVPQVVAAARSVVETLARDGVTAEEFERARRPLVRSTETGLRSNQWWLDAIAVAQSLPVYAEGWAAAMTDYQSATVDQIAALARRVLVMERECRLIVTPATSTAATQ